MNPFKPFLPQKCLNFSPQYSRNPNSLYLGLLHPLSPFSTGHIIFTSSVFSRKDFPDPCLSTPFLKIGIFSVAPNFLCSPGWLQTRHSHYSASKGLDYRCTSPYSSLLFCSLPLRRKGTPRIAISLANPSHPITGRSLRNGRHLKMYFKNE